ncbi:MAG: FtsQ-type POTRA domain-containing protein, partial [Clostridia bacterium]|nr:FtsQ-type POTRA domain-containing protein [Clostridia bacterium]
MGQQKFVRKNMAIYDAQRRHESKRTKRKVFYAFLLVCISLVFLAVCVAVFLNVKTINVNGLERYETEQIMEYVTIAEGDNIFSFEASVIEEKIKESLPYVGAVEIKRDLPSTVEINVTEYKPYFISELAGDSYLISSNLKVLEKTE